MSHERRHPGRQVDDQRDRTIAAPVASGRAGAGATARSLPMRRTSPGDVQLKATDLAATRRTAPAWQADHQGLWSMLSGQPVQAKAAELDSVTTQEVAASGVAGPGASLPHLAQIQRSFGGHDVRSIRAHVGGDATTAATAIGAEAYATGDAVAFRSAPSLHLAAHEAAHVVQQRGGVSLKGGVGAAGDAYEQHADAVADAVVAGRSAEPLLSEFAGTGATSTAIQRKGADAAQVGGLVDKMTTDTSGLAHELALLEHAETDCLNLLEKWRAGTLKSGPAIAKLIEIIRRMYGPVQAFSDARQRMDESGAGSESDQRTLDRWLPRVRDALNTAKRVAMTIEPSPTLQVPLGFDYVHTVENQIPDDVAAQVPKLRSVVTTLEIVGSGVGWDAPANLRQADQARFDHEACPTAAREQRPDACNLTDSERVEHRADVKIGVLKALDNFERACAPHQAAINKMIARDEAFREKIIGKFVGTLSSAFATVTTGGVVAGFVDEIATGVTKAALASFAGPSAGEGTKSFLAALITAMRTHLDGIADRIKSLDDVALRAADAGVADLGVDKFADVLTPLVRAYQSQIDPLGRDVGGTTRMDLNLPPGTHFEYEAVQVKLRGGLRLAQVAHEANTTPQDGATHGKTYHRYIFVRWIDSDFAPVVGDAPVVDMTDIENISFTDFMGSK